MAQIEWIEVQGFRAFGELQRLELGTPLAVIWGPNSQGKTSLAEAFEFLLTGTIVRRELMASSQDEFADALRNAHLRLDQPAFVHARFRSADGTGHDVKRTLTRDFEKRSACESTLEVDGKPATAADLADIGIVLSLPPMAAPILMQHTLGYLFSAKPQERSSYFKALLEVGDLDQLRSDIEGAISLPAVPALEWQAELDAVRTAKLLGDLLDALGAKALSLNDVQHAFTGAARRMVKAGGLTPATDDTSLRAQLTTLLSAKQAKAFPFDGFTRHALGASPFNDFDWQPLRTFGEKDRSVRTDIERLGSLFTELLRLPEFDKATADADCPVCETRGALTLSRLAGIRAALEATSGNRKVGDAAKASLVALKDQLRQDYRRAAASRPDRRGSERRKSGFTTKRMLAILSGDQAHQIRTWLTAVAALLRARRAYLRAVESIGKIIPETPFVDPPLDVKALETKCATLPLLRTAFVSASAALDMAEKPLRDALASAVSTSTNTLAWQDFLTLWEHVADLAKHADELRLRDVVRKECEGALREIDRAKEVIFNDKFSGLSTSIKTWWDLLRPGHPTAFENVGLRPKAQRSIDFKAALYLDDNKLDPKIRDVVSVFSFSQLHCLGLAAFLARTVKEGCGFLLLDDPIMSSDEDHSAHFIDSVIEKLIQQGIQVILMTQDHGIRTSISNRYGHLDVACFQVGLSLPRVGAEVTKTSDALAAMLLRVQPLLGSPTEETRRTAAQGLRIAAERFCKEALVRQARAGGKTTAMLADYGGNLGDLIPLVIYKDPSDMGKLKVIADFMNPGNHDDKPPSAEQIKVAHGNLNKFRKSYFSGAPS
jgi:AAA domain-containing protein